MAIWIGEIALFWAALFAVQAPLRRKPNPVLRAVVFFAKVALIPLTAFFFVSVDSAFSYARGDVLCAAYIALIGDVLSNVIEYAVRRIRGATRAGGEEHPCMQRMIAILSLLTCIVVAAYGISNATTVNKRVHE
jgi:hypothetical protein